MSRAEWRRDALLIGGAWRPSGEVMAVDDPATERTIGTSADGSVEDVELAVAAAREATATWAGTPVASRCSALASLHRELVLRRDLLVETVVAEVGAPVRIAREQHVDLALDVLAYYAAELDRDGTERTIGNSLVVAEPAGVAACITPWNYPLYQLLAKVAPALRAGCPAVIKPAELTPLSSYLVADAAVAARFPAGVLNLVPGRGDVVGEALVLHPEVDVVSFTGSTAVGRRVAAAAAATLKRVGLELGGKSASVVLDGADLDAAVRATVSSAMLNSGQTCSAWTRLLVPAQRYEESLVLADRHAAELRVGDPQDEATDLGPLISHTQRQRVLGYVERAVDAGARALGHPEASADVGHYVAPVVLGDLDEHHEAVVDEIFGPVLCVLPHEGEDDAVRLANASPYGLNGAVWAGDDDQALAVARRVRAGQIDLNGAAFNIAAPFGGFGQSGIGRELGVFGLDEFRELKAIQR